MSASRRLGARARGPRGRSPRTRPGEGCQLAELFAVLGRAHMLRILHEFAAARSEPIRFTDLQQRLRISPRTLSHRLKALVEAGFLARQAYRETPPRVEYRPTEKTGDLGDLFRALDRWAGRNNLRPVPMVSVVGRMRR